MELPLYRSETTEALWRIVAFGQQTVPPRRAYWWENRARTPVGQCVVQATLAGRAIYRDLSGDHPVGTNQLMLFEFGEPSAYGLVQPEDRPYVCEWLNLAGAGIGEHLRALRGRHGSVIDAGENGALIDELRHLASLARPLTTVGLTDVSHALHHFVMRLYEHADHRLAQSQTPVQRAIEQLVRTPNRPWSLKEVADRHGISREHLTRVFQETVGEPPAAHLAASRLRRALHLIRQTDLPLYAVAEQAGFASVHTMARQVRRETGRAPSALRGK